MGEVLHDGYTENAQMVDDPSDSLFVETVKYLKVLVFPMFDVLASDTDHFETNSSYCGNSDSDLVHFNS